MKWGNGILRYCGNCGTALDAAAISSGTCPVCGVALEPPTISATPLTEPPAAGDLQQTVLDPWSTGADDDPWGPTVPLELRLMPHEAMSLASARPATAHLTRVTAHPAATNPWAIIGLGVGLGAALLLVVACTLSFLTMNNHSSSLAAVKPFKTATIGLTATDAGLGFTTQSPDPTPLPYTAPSPLPTDTPYGGIPTATPTNIPPPTQPSEPTATPTPGNGGQATLVVGPPSCKSPIQARFSFTITGSGTFLWQASTTSTQVVSIQPISGQIAAGNDQPIDVRGDLSTPVTIAIIANPGALNGSITIQCK